MPYLPYQYPHTATKHFVTPLMAMGLGTLVEPASAQRSTASQKLNGTGSRASSHSRSFLLNHHCKWKAGETVLGTMSRPVPVLGAILLTLSVFSSPSFAAADCNWTTVSNSVATSVGARGPALSSDGRDTCEANTSKAGGLI